MEKTNETMKETKGMMKETGEPIEETGEPVEETKEPIEETEETIKSFFEKNDWNYRYNEEDNVFSSGINMSNVLGNVKMYITLEKKCYTVYLVLNSKADEECRAVVGSFCIGQIMD